MVENDMRKYLKLMADYCSSGLWDECGSNLEMDDLPIHFWLKRMINDWQAEYDCLAFSTDESVPFGPNFDIESFSKRGYALAVKLKQNLPDWEIEYCREGLGEKIDGVQYFSMSLEKIEL